MYTILLVCEGIERISVIKAAWQKALDFLLDTQQNIFAGIWEK
jgi:hypothetical protein